jgi:hypothetical protein
VLRAVVQRRIRSSKRYYINHTLNEACGSKTWWKHLNKLSKNTTYDLQDKLHIIDNQRLHPEELCQRLNEHFIKVGGDNINITLPSYTGEPVPITELSIGEVKLLMKSLNTSKTTSKQDFPTWISKNSVEDIAIPLCNIINCMLSTRTYPSLWKVAQIIPLPKAKQPNQLSDYRPVSLLFHLGKIAEQVIINKLQSFLKIHLDNNQFAYQRQRSTTDALLAMLDDWTMILDSSSPVY